MYSKKTVATVFSLLLVFSFLPLTLAQADSSELDAIEDEIAEIEVELDAIDAGTTPDSAFYGIEKFFEGIGYALSFDKDTKGLKRAEECLEELKEMSQEGNVEAAQEASECHEKMVSRVKARVETRLSESDGDTDDLTAALKVEAALALQENEIEELKDLLTDLTPGERRQLLALLLEQEQSISRFRGELEDTQSDTLIKFEDKLGKSRLEIRSDLDRLREVKRLKAEVLSDISIVTVSYKFKQRSESGAEISTDALLTRLLEAVATDQAEAESSTKIERGDDDSESDAVVQSLEAIGTSPITGQQIDDTPSESDSMDDSSDDFVDGNRLRVKIEIEHDDDESKAEVEFKLRFLSGTDDATIHADIVEQTNALTIDELRSAMRLKEEHDDDDSEDDNEREVEVEVRTRSTGEIIAEVKVEWDGLEDHFIVPSGDRTEILAEIAARLGVDVAEVEAALTEFEIDDDDDSDSDDDSDMDDESDDSMNDNSGSSSGSGNDGSSGSGSGNSEDDETVDLTDPDETFDITGVNFAFEMDGETNPTLTVDEGDVVEITFSSTDGFHDWVVDEFDAATAQVNPEDGAVTVTFVADTAGEYEYYCSVGSHRENGMVGTLIVA